MIDIRKFNYDLPSRICFACSQVYFQVDQDSQA